MSKPSILIGILLIILGVASYFLTGQVSKTAFIPCGPGILLVFFGLLGLKESLRKHMMHSAVLISLLGTLAGFGKALGGGLVGMSEAPNISSLIMGALCLVHLVMSIRSFRAAREAGG